MAGKTLDHKRAAAAPPSGGSYRDDLDAVSMHTTRSDYDYDDVPEPPSYSDSVAADSTAGLAGNEAPPPADEYQVITQPAKAWGGNRNKSCSQRVTLGNETTIRIDGRLQDADQLFNYITDYLRVIAPRPHVRMQGWHWETRKKDNKKEQERVFDFDVVLSMEKFIQTGCSHDFWVAETASNSDKVHRGSWRKIRAPGYKQDIEVGGDGKQDLMEWCQDFCGNKSALKIFRVSRSVTGWDTDWLRDELIPLVRSTHYRGHIDITFPISDKHVDIYTPHWVNRARISWVRWIFYLSFFWLITWPILFFLTKRWDVYNVDWRYSAEVEHEPGRRTKRYATISEKDWLQRHANLIQSLVMDKFHGDGTTMPLNVDIEAQRRRASGVAPQTGNRNVDAAVNFIQGGVGVWNALNGRGDQNGWGNDS